MACLLYLLDVHPSSRQNIGSDIVYRREQQNYSLLVLYTTFLCKSESVCEGVPRPHMSSTCPRNVVKRGTCYRDVCPSVRPSVCQSVCLSHS